MLAFSLLKMLTFPMLSFGKSQPVHWTPLGPFILGSLHSPLDGWTPPTLASAIDHFKASLSQVRNSSLYLLPRQTMHRPYGYTLTWERFQSVAILYTSLCTRSYLLGAAVQYLAILRLPGPQWAGESVRGRA